MPLLDACPLVLSGPMVRRATPASVSVWIALQDARAVRLRIFDNVVGVEVASGESRTVPLGEFLHVAVTTATGDLEWGRSYSYDLHFECVAGSRGHVSGSLFSPGVVVPDEDPAVAQFETAQRLTYVTLSQIAPGLPSFVLPPESLDDVRLVHSSCRMPHGNGVDELSTLDAMIRASMAGGDVRPQQLFLHGDQIYADEIADELLPVISELGAELLGWRESFPDLEQPLEEYEAGSRDPIMMECAGLWEPSGGCHLLGLGEFYAMYLLNWSEVLWRTPTSIRYGQRLRSFRRTMPAVRRAMANIAVYMIFDDHEVTDDWNLTLEWSEGVLAKPLGRRLITNALSAFAVFQAWGNTPDLFETASEGDDPPGRRVLDALVHGDQQDELAPLLGIPPAGDIRKHDPPQLVPPTGSLVWHFRIECPQYELVVLDQRTQRAFPGGHRDPPALLSERAIDEQIHRGGGFDKPVTVVISSAVLLAIPRPWYVRAVQWLGYRYRWINKGFPDGYLDVYGPDRGDIWEAQTPAFERLLGAIEAAVTSGNTTSRVVWLCGDVHVGFAVRLQYWAHQSNSSAVLVQLTSTPLRRQKSGTRLQGRLGYGLGRNPPRQGWAGWEDAPRVELTTAPPLHGSLRRPAARGAPALLPLTNESALLLSTPPDWTYRCDYLRADDGCDVLGVNHVSEVRFSWSDEVQRKEVLQIMWWRTDDDEPAEPRTRFRASLELDDEAHPRPSLTIIDDD